MTEGQGTLQGTGGLFVLLFYCVLVYQDKDGKFISPKDIVSQMGF